MTMQPTYYVGHPDGSFSVAVPQPLERSPATHPDDEAVDRFATAMKSMLAKERGPSRPWWNSDEASNLGLSNSLRNCVERGDPVGVANYCMLLHQRGEAILPASTTLDDPKSAQGEALGEIHHGSFPDGGKWFSVELYRLPPGGARLYAGPVAQAMPGLPLDDDVREILGRPNFQCISFAQCLRSMGHDIPHKAEAEQAAVIYWMLGHYFRHGADWWKAAADELTRGKEAAAKDKDDEN